ncbi:MAG: DUF1269 domain-containing protein [Armatimonadetes bacterium]|nr:MAG: DUF1269 domain-containing protein [Armatimonadota bacterium]
MTDDTTEVTGPIDFLLLEFPDQEPTGETAGALVDLVERDIIRLYDLAAIRKGADGSVSAIEIASVDPDGFGLFEGAQSGLLGSDDIEEAAAAMEPGTVAVLIVYENRWAAPFVAAAMNAGGQVVASARIPAQDIIEALDSLDTQA